MFVCRPIQRLIVNTLSKQIECISNPFRSESKLNAESNSQAYHFHKTLPGYKPTPLVSLKNLSNQLGIQEILVKDESQRLGLNAFKVLGASYAMALEIQRMLGSKDTPLTYETIKKEHQTIKKMTFVTATDGNHGRAVAWSAKHFGCKAVVYMPEGSSDFRLKAIQQLHADAEITDVNYDDTVKYAESQALTNNWILLQDSSWPGYVDVAKHIMMGYTTMVEEFIEQASDWPTHVIAQAGVGSFAASMFACFSQTNKAKPKLILLEPTGAACFFNSIKIGDGQPHLTQELNTIMAGLSCGLPSVLAWDIITQVTDIFAVCDDELAFQGMRLFAHPNQGDPLIVSGESGAAPLGFIHEICTNEAYTAMKNLLEIDSASTVLIFSTEGDTDPELYAKILR